jgi:hypothetical protein
MASGVRIPRVKSKSDGNRLIAMAVNDHFEWGPMIAAPRGQVQQARSCCSSSRATTSTSARMPYSLVRRAPTSLISATALGMAASERVGQPDAGVVRPDGQSFDRHD